MDVSISVIIPTVGRDTLSRAVASCEGADEVIVIVDRARVPEGLTMPGVRILDVESCNRGGHSSRNAAMPLATGTHLAFLDDDDVFTPGAIQTMRAAACDRPVIFKMDHPQHGVLWRDPELRFGNVSTQMFLVPNDPARLGVWAHHAPELPQPGGDFTFIRGCVEKMGEPVWRDELIAIYDPDFTTIAIVTPWLNHPELVPDYLAAIAALSYRDELIVIDNASEPPIDFAALRLADNAGFSVASNIGLRAASSDVVLFLNNDIAPTQHDWLELIRSVVEPGVLVGSIRHDPHGAIDGVSLPYLDGWCIAGMRDELLDLNGFDETYDEPAYYVDNDLCLRARAAGLVLREARIGLTHKTGATANEDTATQKAATAANRERFAESARDLLKAFA